MFCSKRRKTEKVGKGLRHFSMKVCEKVKKKGTTSYNEVADELVGEFTNPAHMNSLTDQVFISYNICILYRKISVFYVYIFIRLSLEFIFDVIPFSAIRSEKYQKTRIRRFECINGNEYHFQREKGN